MITPPPPPPHILNIYSIYSIGPLLLTISLMIKVEQCVKRNALVNSRMIIQERNKKKERNLDVIELKVGITMRQV